MISGTVHRTLYCIPTREECFSQRLSWLLAAAWTQPAAWLHLVPAVPNSTCRARATMTRSSRRICATSRLRAQHSRPTTCATGIAAWLQPSAARHVHRSVPLLPQVAPQRRRRHLSSRSLGPEPENISLARSMDIASASVCQIRPSLVQTDACSQIRAALEAVIGMSFSACPLATVSRTK